MALQSVRDLPGQILALPGYSATSAVTPVVGFPQGKHGHLAGSKRDGGWSL